MVSGAGRRVEALAGRCDFTVLHIFLSCEHQRASCAPFLLDSHFPLFLPCRMNCSGSALPFLGAPEPHGLALKVKRLQGRKNKDNNQQRGNWLLCLFLPSYQRPSDRRGRPFPSCCSSGSEILRSVLAGRNAEAVLSSSDSVGPGWHLGGPRGHAWQDSDPLLPSAQSFPASDSSSARWGPQHMGCVRTREEGQQW